MQATKIDTQIEIVDEKMNIIWYNGRIIHLSKWKNEFESSQRLLSFSIFCDCFSIQLTLLSLLCFSFFLYVKMVRASFFSHRTLSMTSAYTIRTLNTNSNAKGITV